MFLSLLFVSFTVNAILKTLGIFLFRMLCCQCWKTASVHQRMIMLDEWDEDNELAPLEPVVERVGSTATSFTFSNCGSRLGGVTSGMLQWEKWKKAPPPPPFFCSRQWVDERIRLWALLTNSVEEWLVSER